jgi:DNA polymerase III epsilon subunit-like protein
MKLVVVDTETGGLDPRVHSLLSVGMWTLDTVEGTLYNPLYFLVREPHIVTVPQAMKVNGLKVEYIEKDGLDPHAALHLIRNYCRDLGDKPSPVAHNVAFDMAFLNRLVRLTDTEGAGLPFHYRTVDVPSILTTLYLAGVLPEDISSSQKALKYFGMERGSVHNALHDAECTGKVYLKLLGILSDINSGIHPRWTDATPPTGGGA